MTANENDSTDKENYSLYVSDGSASIFELDGDNLEVTRTITVRDEDDRIWDDINELEYVDGYIYANVCTRNGS